MAAKASDLQELTEKKQEAEITETLSAEVTKFESLEDRIRQITWLTGANGERVLPFLTWTNNTLIPTGELLEMGIAPFAGELDLGVTIRGINQTCLSGVLPKSFLTAWRYANFHKPIDLQVSEDDSFAKLTSIIEGLIKNFQDEGYLFGDSPYSTPDFALYVLRARQFNEKRYQEEFVRSGLMDKFLAIFQNDENYFIVKRKKLIQNIFNLEIPGDIKLQQNKDASQLFVFLSQYLEKNLEKPGKKCIPLSTIVRNYSRNLEVYTKHRKNKPNDSHDSAIQEWVSARLYPYKVAADSKAMIAQDLYDEYLRLPIVLLLTRICDDKSLDSKLKDEIIRVIDAEIDLLNTMKTRLMNAVKSGPAFQISKEQRQEMLELGALPVVFATSRKLLFVENGTCVELPYRGNLRLGEDITIVFTDETNQAKLHNYLKGKGIKNVTVCKSQQCIQLHHSDFGTLESDLDVMKSAMHQTQTKLATPISSPSTSAKPILFMADFKENAVKPENEKTVNNVNKKNGLPNA